MLFDNEPNKCVKTLDGEEIWVSRACAVTLCAVLKLDEQGYFVLLEKRGPDMMDEPNKWCLPCGYIDWNETGRDACVREAWEEVGLNITPWLLHDAQPWYVNTDPQENRQNITLRYGFRKWASSLPKLVPNNCGEGLEVTDARWVSLNYIENFEMAFNHDKVIEEFIKSKVY